MLTSIPASRQFVGKLYYLIGPILSLDFNAKMAYFLKTLKITKQAKGIFFLILFFFFFFFFWRGGGEAVGDKYIQSSDANNFVRNYAKPRFWRIFLALWWNFAVPKQYILLILLTESIGSLYA